MAASSSLETIFFAALEKNSPAERATYLEQACAGDSDLRAQIDRMLAAQANAGSFLENPAGAIERTVTQPVVEKPGMEIGPYKLLQEIGEGGMGVVFLAEQREPIKRRIALKIIKPGMDTRQIIARFEAERQALAMMDHPNIAKVLDARTTQSGRPYFVMELVNGIPITTYCDQQQLTTKERLDLFIPICQAIQHAHQKGIIHRDIKPGNVLVAMYDDKPVPKVIDFGVAKATNQTLTEKTMFTQLGQIVGTLEYMSPEQAIRNQLDVDTRSDIYSLGVLLYEMLTGDTPFGKQRLQSAALDETLRIIREEDPPKPSTKISRLGVNANAISKARNTSPDGLCRIIRGDLDWLVMKALEKDRGRRYETAGSFAADVRRLVDGEAIEARPPSAYYRLHKTITRNRAAFVTAAIVMLALLIGIVTSAWFAARSIEANRELQMTMLKLHGELIEKVILNAQSGDRQGTYAAMELAKESKVPAKTLQMLEGISHYYRGDNEAAIQILENVLRLEPNNETARAMLALSYGHHGGWNRYIREMLLIANPDELTERKDYETLILGCALLYFDTAQSLKMLQKMVDSHPEWAVARAMLGGAKAHRALESPDAALANEALRETKLAWQLLPNNRVVALYNVWAHRVAIYFAQTESEPYGDLRQDAEASIRLLEESYADYTAGTYNIAAFYEVIGDNEAAIDVLSRAIGNADHDGWTCHYVGLLVQSGRLDEALRLLDTIEVHSVSGRSAKAHLLATIPERREEAELLCDSLLDESEPLDAGSCAIEILCLLGERAKVVSESQKCLDLLSKRRVTNWMPEKSLAFHAGKTIDEFDQDCGETPIGRMEFHYHVAMRKLSERDRQGAIRHLNECAESSLIDSGYHKWALAFRRLLADNPNWPTERESMSQ